MLTFVFLLAINALLTQTSILWGPTAVANQSGDLVFAQVYRVARRVYAPEQQALRAEADDRVALLGNSRILLAIGTSPLLEQELETLRPGRNVHVDQLGIFGAAMEEVELVSRHVDAVEPDLVVLTVGSSDLLMGDAGEYETHTAKLLEIGWEDGSEETTVPQRLERWLRTVWPTYRFREFLRRVIADRLWTRGEEEPDSLARIYTSVADVLNQTRGEFADEALAAYDAWIEEGSLDHFLDYVSIGRKQYLGMEKYRVKRYRPAEPDAPGVRALDAVLERLAQGDYESRIVLMPRVDVLDQDTDHVYHRPEIEAHAIEVIEESAARWGIPVIDARDWSPREVFLDFDHLIPAVSGFEKPLAKELNDALPAGSS